MATLLVWLAIFTTSDGTQVPHTFPTSAQCEASVQAWTAAGLDVTRCVVFTLEVSTSVGR